MAILYVVMIVLAALTLYFNYGAYKKGQKSKKQVALICALELVVMVFAILGLARVF
jgi:uncharacterized membrane protein